MTEAERIAAEAAAAAEAKASADKAAADKLKADQAAADKTAADKTAADKAPTEKKTDTSEADADAKAARADAAALRAEMAAMKKRFEGIDPEASRKAVSDAREAEQKTLESKGEFERVRAMIIEDADKRLAEANARVTELETTGATTMQRINDLTIGQSFTSSAFIADKLTLTPSKTRALYGSHFELEDGTAVAYDKPRGEAGRVKLIDSRGSNVSFETAIEKIIMADPEHEHLLRSTLRQGANSKPSDKKVDAEVVLKGVDRIRAGLKARSAG